MTTTQNIMLPMHHTDLSKGPRPVTAADFAAFDTPRVFRPHECKVCAKATAYVTGLGLCEPCDLDNMQAELAARCM